MQPGGFAPAVEVKDEGNGLRALVAGWDVAEIRPGGAVRGRRDPLLARPDGRRATAGRRSAWRGRCGRRSAAGPGDDQHRDERHGGDPKLHVPRSIPVTPTTMSPRPTGNRPTPVARP